MKMKKKFLLSGMTALLSLSLIACQSNETTKVVGSKDGKDSGKKQTLHVAALESAYGKDMWTIVIDAYIAIQLKLYQEYLWKKRCLVWKRALQIIDYFGKPLMKSCVF
ncbi:hypothetical protein [Bacillus sp. AFS031507]|uniref:hypothetical protein n=1 Tax=Bacillus sp. AFS031507 TaxID=2033496 RepID=UPI00211ED662|nr:hypothetical protein [Bacillus sp. AFS031507]